MGEASTTITAVNAETDDGETFVGKKVLYSRIMHWYNDGVHVDRDDHEGDKVRKLTRGSIFKGYKFCTGEGREAYRIVKAACERAEKYAVVHGLREHNDLILTPTPPRQHHPPARTTHTPRHRYDYQ